MATGFTPPTMNWNASDIPDEFNSFKQYCNLVFDGPFLKKTEKEKASYILLWIGQQGVDIYNSFVWENEQDKVKPKAIWEKYGKHLAPVSNYRLARFQLQQVRKEPNENIDDFMTRLDLHLITLNCSVEKSQVQETSPTKDTAKLKPSTCIDNKSHLIAQYPNCFNGIGKFQGEYHITLDPSVPPVIHQPRRVPISLKDDIKHELEEMEQLDITKVREGEPTAWVNSLVYGRKPNGRLRICLDPKDLNAAIQRDHHVTPTLEEILPKLNGATHFSILDARSGYWNVTLDEESSYLTTFNSPFGRYRFKRMPFGLKMSQDVFQSKIDQTFEGCNGVVGIADDIVVFGKTAEEHDENLHGMMEMPKHRSKAQP
jgi:hypothetical protein